MDEPSAATIRLPATFGLSDPDSDLGHSPGDASAWPVRFVPDAFDNQSVAVCYGAAPDLYIAPGEVGPPRIDSGLPRLVPTEDFAGLPIDYFVLGSLSRHVAQSVRTALGAPGRHADGLDRRCGSDAPTHPLGQCSAHGDAPGPQLEVAQDQVPPVGGLAAVADAGEPRRMQEGVDQALPWHVRRIVRLERSMPFSVCVATSGYDGDNAGHPRPTTPDRHHVRIVVERHIHDVRTRLEARVLGRVVSEPLPYHSEEWSKELVEASYGCHATSWWTRETGMLAAAVDCRSCEVSVGGRNRLTAVIVSRSGVVSVVWSRAQTNASFRSASAGSQNSWGPCALPKKASRKRGSTATTCRGGPLTRSADRASPLREEQ